MSNTDYDEPEQREDYFANDYSSSGDENESDAIHETMTRMLETSKKRVKNPPPPKALKRNVILDDRYDVDDPNHEINFYFDKSYNRYSERVFNMVNIQKTFSNIGHRFSYDLTKSLLIPLAFDVDCMHRDKGRCDHNKNIRKVVVSLCDSVLKTMKLNLKKRLDLKYIITKSKATCGFHIYFDAMVTTFVYDVLYDSLKVCDELTGNHVLDKPTSLGLPYYIKLTGYSKPISDFKHDPFDEANFSTHCIFKPQNVFGLNMRLTVEQVDQQVVSSTSIETGSGCKFTNCGIIKTVDSTIPSKPLNIFDNDIWTEEVPINKLSYTVGFQSVNHSPVLIQFSSEFSLLLYVEGFYKQLLNVCDKFKTRPVYSTPVTYQLSEKTINNFIDSCSYDERIRLSHTIDKRYI